MNIDSIAATLASTAHAGQTRPDGLTLYIVHPMRVAARPRAAGASAHVLATAWLHDVLEDTKTTVADMVAAGMPAPVISAVEALTRRKGEAYTDYIARVKANEIARVVKQADMLDNLTDNPKNRQIAKYAAGLMMLLDVYPRFDAAVMGAPQYLPTCEGRWAFGDGRAHPVHRHIGNELHITFRHGNTWRVTGLPKGMRGEWRRVGNLEDR